MSLSTLFRRHAEICFQMARAAQSVEIQDQWYQLARHWDQKAEAEERSSTVDRAAPLRHTAAPALTLVPEVTQTTANEEPLRLVATPLRHTAAPALTLVPVPEVTQTTAHEEPLRLVAAPRIVNTAQQPDGADDIWAKIAAHINLQD